MMDYPRYWNMSITVFTRLYCVDSADNYKKIKWYRYTFDNCFFTQSQTSYHSGRDLYQKNQNIIRIPVSENYVPYKEWCEMSETQKTAYWSITAGSLLFLDVIRDEIPTNSSGNDLLKKYDPDCFTVDVFKDNTNFIPKHYFIGGG